MLAEYATVKKDSRPNGNFSGAIRLAGIYGEECV